MTPTIDQLRARYQDEQQFRCLVIALEPCVRAGYTVFDVLEAYAAATCVATRDKRRPQEQRSLFPVEKGHEG